MNIITETEKDINEEMVVDTTIIPNNVADLRVKYKVEIDTLLEMLKLNQQDVEEYEDMVMVVDIFIMKLREGLLKSNELLQKILQKYPDVDISKIE